MTMNSPAMLFAACAIVVGFSVITLGPARYRRRSGVHQPDRHQVVS